MSEPVAEGTSFESVTAYLSWDHDRLEGLLNEASLKVDSGRLKEARESYRAFESGLSRHIRMEEELLFPVFEARMGMAGPTAVMRLEHREIEKAMKIMREGLEEEDPQAFRKGLDFLGTVLPDHNSKEEHILYPTTDQSLSDGERALFTARLQREPA
jgi:iron-sulfur cluster repair protein YtfE (RIC family)